MLTKRSANVDKTVRNVLKTFTKRNAQKRSQNVDKTLRNVLKTFTKHSENIDQSVFSVTAFIRTSKDGRDGTLVSPLCTCVLNGLFR
jgi:hypothetical protein